MRSSNTDDRTTGSNGAWRRWMAATALAVGGLGGCAGGDVPDDEGAADFGLEGDGDDAAEACLDGRKNGEETDVDCGGPVCDGCDLGQTCGGSADCVDSLVCEQLGGTCVEPDCANGAQDGDETDVDCGGASCEPCGEGQGCGGPDDCDSGVCTNASCAPPMCGDGVVNGNETCDDGGPSDTCGANCQLPGCGNGMLDPGETCDQGTETATCDGDCSSAVCGDGYVNAAAGESCDTAGPSATCDGDCTAVECGDGVLNSAAGEQCEEGGMESATCDVDCTLPMCGDGVPNAAAGETCDTAGNSATCDGDCTAVECGDARVNTAAGEQCDTGGMSATCDDDCTNPMCGDGVLNTAAGEACDDGNVTANDGCSPTCQNEFPAVCTMGSAGVQQGPDWVVCEANAAGAWLSHGPGGGGIYNPLQACQSIGYNSVGGSGGTCGDVCGYCQDGSSCTNPGPKNFTGGGTLCGAGLLCYTVMWECLP